MCDYNTDDVAMLPPKLVTCNASYLRYSPLTKAAIDFALLTAVFDTSQLVWTGYP